jgi:hypothetical protein
MDGLYGLRAVKLLSSGNSFTIGGLDSLQQTSFGLVQPKANGIRGQGLAAQKHDEVEQNSK